MNYSFMIHEWKNPVYKEIYQRIQLFRERSGKDWRDKFFNNFRMFIPRRGEFCCRVDEKYLDKPHLGFDWKNCNGCYSDLLGNQTTRQFKETIEEVIKISGASEEQLTDAVDQNKGLRYSFKIFFPIYFRLRKKGYTESELQA